MIKPLNIEWKSIIEKIDFSEFYAEKLSPTCVDEDYEAVIKNEILIKKTRGNAGDWPNPEKFTLEENYIDLAWHQREFEYGLSFAYVLRTHEGKYMGCVYLYPMNFRTKEENWDDYDIDFSFWIVQEYFDTGWYEKIKWVFLEHLHGIGFRNICYSNIV